MRFDQSTKITEYSEKQGVYEKKDYLYKEKCMQVFYTKETYQQVLF